MRATLRILVAAASFLTAARVASADDSPAPSDCASCQQNAPASDCASCGCAECGCGECAADDWCCDCEPVWTVKAGLVYLNRSRPDASAIAVPLAGPGTISSGADFDFGWATGPDVSISRRMASGNSWEVRYFGALDWDSQANYGAVGDFQLGSFSNFGATALDANYQSTLHNTEINWWHPVGDRVSLLLGFRWIELHESLDYNVTFPAFSAVYNWNIDNHLYGGQIGANFALWKSDGPFTLNCAAKAGIYDNVANNNFSLAPSTGGLFTGGASSSPIAFVGDVNISAAYRLTPHVAVRGGYQLLWIDSVALASDTAALATASSSNNVIDTAGQAFYQGATASLDFTW